MLFPAPAKIGKRKGGEDVGEVFWQFLIYSFFGFLFEIAFARAVHHPKRDRKCHLVLPVCPVYGFGALAILALPGWVKSSPFLLYLGGALAATAVEWALAVFYEKAAGTPFWDYTALPWNFQGRVCFIFSLFWGLLALPLVYGVQPWLEPRLALIPDAVTIPAALFYLGDAATSLFLLRRLGTGGLRWYARFRPSEAR